MHSVEPGRNPPRPDPIPVQPVCRANARSDYSGFYPDELARLEFSLRRLAGGVNRQVCPDDGDASGGCLGPGLARFMAGVESKTGLDCRLRRTRSDHPAPDGHFPGDWISRALE